MQDRDGWEATGEQLARASHPPRKSIVATSQQKTAGVVTAAIHHLSACGAWERGTNEPSEVSQIEFVSEAFLCTEKKKNIWCGAFQGNKKTQKFSYMQRENKG